MKAPKIYSYDELINFSKKELFYLARDVGIIYHDKVEETITKEELIDTILLEGRGYDTRVVKPPSK